MSVALPDTFFERRAGDDISASSNIQCVILSFLHQKTSAEVPENHGKDRNSIN